MRTSQLRLFIGFTLLLALDLILRNYNGIRHDSILYFGQGLRELNPEAFKNDLFFEFGSQSSYTVFPQLLGWALTYWTPGQISRAGLLIGFVMYLAGSWTVVRRLYAQTWPQGAFVALVLLVAWPLGYGGFNVFRFHEPYLTARTYAEPLVLFSLSMLLAGKQLWALVFVAAASLLHPLQALGGGCGCCGWYGDVSIASDSWTHMRPCPRHGGAGCVPFFAPVRALRSCLVGGYKGSPTNMYSFFNGRCSPLCGRWQTCSTPPSQRDT